ncbi:hypothetical protein TNCT_490561 [Trichonephila clavata]|uniref:Uncharacterized protein n=1 Tax=Trichonephila clavata TaxID=2740835 RepID=A0A8X6KPQ2_TRICU|nr:hypothetical protein TNCT_490561 [Trichonephila clavata]
MRGIRSQQPHPMEEVGREQTASFQEQLTNHKPLDIFLNRRKQSNKKMRACDGSRINTGRLIWEDYQSMSRERGP